MVHVKNLLIQEEVLFKMGEIVTRKETQLSTDKESHLIGLTESDKGKWNTSKQN